MSPSPMRWDLLTGEYPPQPGGVADYSRLVAEGLAKRGCEVHVWTAAAVAAPPEVPGVTVHAIDHPWSRSGLQTLDRALGPHRRLLVQYTPNAWGKKGLNLGFCRWLAARGKGGDHVRLMFHELSYYIQPRDKPTRWILPVVHHLMLRTVLSGASAIDYAAEEWGRQLKKFRSARGKPMTWLPVPSNIPVVNDPDAVGALRRRIAPDGQTIIGSFGTYGDDLRGRLLPVFPRVALSRPDRVGLLIGRHGDRFAAEIQARYPELAKRLIVVGDLEGAEVSRYLQTCDILVQPYPDGVCGRRGTAMACLAHGLPFATNLGPFTEPALAESACAAFAPPDDPEALIAQAERLLADPAACASFANQARITYHRHFALERTIDHLI